MRNALLAAAICLSSTAFAGERYLGTITSTGSDTTNATTATPFFIPKDAKVTMQCDATAYVLTDSSSAVTSSNGIKLSSDALFPTSTGSLTKDTTATLADGGTNTGYGGAIIRVISSSGTVSCKVWERRGNE